MSKPNAISADCPVVHLFLPPINAAAFQVVVTRTTPAVGLLVDPVSGDSSVLPMNTATACEIASLLLGTANA